MLQFASLIKDVHPGIFVHSIFIEQDLDKDRQAGFYGNVNDQIELVATQLANIPELENGFDAIGFSQGGQFLRAYVERYNLPPVNNLITFGSQHMGISDIPACNRYDLLCQIARRTIRQAVYGDWAQENLIQAQYFRDPWNLEKYLAANHFLTSINNEVVATRNATYARNLTALKNLVLVLFTDDKTVVPKESAWFGSEVVEEERSRSQQVSFFSSSEPAILPMRRQPIYLEDWIGLLTPRLRMMRNSQVNYDRSGQTASTSEPGPSRLPEFSQLIDVNLNDMAMSDTTEQPSGSRVSTPSTVTRLDTPAEALRALLSRLPAEKPSPVRSRSPSQQYPSERESDYDISELADATTSRAQESLKDIFSKARRDSDISQTSRPRRYSADTSDVDPTPKFVKDKTISKGKQRSLSDDDIDQRSQSPRMNKTATRSKVSPRPVTMEFLRERFSDSFVSPEVAQRLEFSAHRSGRQAFQRNLDASMASPPMATSTPQQSLRMSVNEQFHTNLLESDTEMQQAIDGLDEYDDISNRRSISPPPTIRKGSKWLTEKHNSSHLHQQSSPGYDLHRTRRHNLSNSMILSHLLNSFPIHCGVKIRPR
ncbi:hypothetical protein CVT25_012197 [Psilocybe cyanescens]|uniref:Palmitoyl-protein thioesterase 1 n=1 Tax=Psilocybe cyanescens TaxID=93625 RepID=A0A409XFJ9_PSICY|nr:hypothetical protein CVT25_012197 [Psilocybe cyanescens]